MQKNHDEISVGDVVLIECCAAGKAYSDTNAIIQKTGKDGSLLAELTIHNDFYGVKRQVVLKPDDTFRKVVLENFDVTVYRSGGIEVLAVDGDQAMRLVNRLATDEDVNWCEDWPADEARPVNDTCEER